jgi:hypothetical protein
LFFAAIPKHPSLTPHSKVLRRGSARPLGCALIAVGLFGVGVWAPLAAHWAIAAFMTLPLVLGIAALIMPTGHILFIEGKNLFWLDEAGKDITRPFGPKDRVEGSAFIPHIAQVEIGEWPRLHNSNARRYNVTLHMRNGTAHTLPPNLHFGFKTFTRKRAYPRYQDVLDALRTINPDITHEDTSPTDWRDAT